MIKNKLNIELVVLYLSKTNTAHYNCQSCGFKVLINETQPEWENQRYYYLKMPGQMLKIPWEKIGFGNSVTTYIFSKDCLSVVFYSR